MKIKLRSTCVAGSLRELEAMGARIELKQQKYQLEPKVSVSRDNTFKGFSVGHC